MKIGNDLIHFVFDDDYICFQLFPLCFYIMVTNMIIITFHIFSISFSIHISKDNNFFN